MPRKVGVSAGAVTRSVRGRRAHGRAHGPAAAAQGGPAQLRAETALGRKMEFLSKLTVKATSHTS